MAELDELLREIEESPRGDHIAAFFDIDGTLVAGTTGATFLVDRMRRNQMSPRKLATLFGAVVSHRLNGTDKAELLGRTSSLVAGTTEADFRDTGKRLFESRISRHVYPETHDLVDAHRRRGHTVALATAASRYQAEPIAEDMGIDHLLCSEMEVENGVLTGGMAVNLWGAGKLRAVEQFAEQHDLDLTQSWFYTNGEEDIPLLERVGNPRALNPSAVLAEVATDRNWPQATWTSRGGIDPLAVARSVAALTSAFPSFAAAVPAGVLNRSRRTVFELGVGTWAEFATAISGVKLNVVGRENLYRQLPAVFIVNHQSSLDFIVAMKLFRDIRYTPVAKKEIASNPLMGPLMKLVDPVFVDRKDTQAAIQAMEPAVQKVKQGYSILIAPEGRRTSSRGIQHFKKGAFRMAMAAQVPIVPVILRNAQDLMPGRSMLIRPGTVDVCVLQPISVEDWTHDELPERIEEVRQLFIQTLENWPKGIASREPETSAGSDD